MATKVTRAARVLLGSTVLATLPAAVEAVTTDDEPNDTFATRQTAGAGDVILGDLAVGIPPNPPSFPGVPTDLADFYEYSLTPNSFFDIFVELIGQFDNEPVLAQALNSAQGGIDSAAMPAQTSAHLTGQVPLDGKVILGLSLSNPTGAGGAEEYRVTLNAVGVPLPASAVLLAAGLVGLGGLHVARRRRAA
jgi:hypothetical protein